MALGQLGDDALFARALGILKSLETLPDNMGGVFTCTLLTDAAGALTVDARGAFSASG